jgi:hypothetical protein
MDITAVIRGGDDRQSSGWVRQTALRLPAMLAAVMALATGLVMASARPAAADPAGPTDYRTEIVSIEPPVDGLEIEIIGGDSFIQLTAPRGFEIVVVGYAGEPYLRFEPDGTVRRNERSPARWLNDDRFGESAVPPEATADAEPEWTTVADDGSYAWHDHRTHWMNTTRPPGAEPGDVVLEAVVPLAVDGAEVGVHVRSTLLAGPSPLTPLAGGPLGAAAAGFAGWRGGVRVLAGVATVAAAASSAAGLWAWLSVPAETGPSLLLWVLPLLALVAAALVASGRSPGSASPAGIVTPTGAGAAGVSALLAFAAVELGLWSWIRREALVRALIPSDAPPALDRLVIAGTAAVAMVTLAYLSVIHLWIREPRPAPRSAR